MKIALAFPGCNRRGGIERVFTECANYLAAQGHDAHVIAAEIAEEVLDPEVIRHKTSTPFSKGLLGLVMFHQASRRELGRVVPVADVVAGFGAISPPGAVVWAQSVHAAWLETSRRQRGFKARLKQRLNPFHSYVISMERRYFGGRQYKRMIALTPEVKNDLMRFYSVPDEDIDILPNGFSPGEFNLTRRALERDAIRKQLGYHDQDQVVVFAANELERKGFGPLLRAIALLGRRNVHLLAVGRLNPSAYAGEIAALGMADRVRFTGPTSDVAKFYACADVFGLPTQYEAWGLVIVEAMACGLPALTSGLAGAAVAVRQGWSGELLDDPRNVDEIRTKLASLLDGKHADAAAISASVNDYRWDRVLPRYESILRQGADAPDPYFVAEMSMTAGVHR